MAAPATGAIQSTTTLSGGPSPSTINLTSEETSKPTYSSKVGNAKGRQFENSGPAAVTAQRHPSTQRAWGSGTNSTNLQSPQNPSLRNGASSQTQGITAGGSSGVLREGLKVKITLDTGAEYEGVFSTATDSSYTLEMVKKLSGSGEMPNGTSRTNREQSSMSFLKKDVSDLHVSGAALPLREVKPQNGNASGFRTDSAISGNKTQGERTLKRWVPDESIETDLSLESSSGGWDQFAANERLFGLKTDYDETIYTTVIDKNHPEYNKRYAEADRKAREIEASVANNRHVAEERITDNLTIDDSGLDEEDKYSGVQKQDFPPLTASGRPDKYTPPARRAPTGQPTVSGAPVDPAIISSQLARPERPVDAGKPSPLSKLAKAEVATPPSTAESSVTPTPEPKATPADSSTSASRTASPQAKPVGVPNATATVERDVVSAFKGFAAQQRVQADKLRSSKAKADKEVKLTELKKFAANFKLTSPLPHDLVAIIAKDPAKQREIQEQARRNAEQSEAAKQARASASGTATPSSSASEQKTPQRPSAAAAASASAALSRQNPARSSTSAAPQGPYASQSLRPDRPSQTSTIPPQGRSVPPLSTRLRNIEQGKNAQLHGHEVRQPPTGPANAGDQNFSRRSSGTISMMSAKLNPNSHEFKPSPFAASFNPNGNPSTASSPRSNSTSTANQAIPSPSGSLLRKKPVQPSEDSKKPVKTDIFEHLAKLTPPAGKKWDDNGGVKPAYDTPPTWKQMKDDEPPESMMHQTYAKLFENAAFSNQAMSPPQPSHVHPQMPHQHQLPFHLQQGAHISQRQSPRQPPMHIQNQHGHGPTFSGPDEHRMMPSHSAQSYASPRLQQVNMAYPAPMGQSPQLAYNQPGMQYPMGSGAPQMAQYRSFSGGHQFVPPQAAHMGAPVMLQGPAGNTFMGGPGMVSAPPQMIYPVGQPHFVPPGTGPPPVMPGSAGYPSPGRGAPMMMTQGSQQGQQVYGMSPGVQYGQPIYAQQAPNQMPNMRGYPAQGQQHFGTSPQMHQFGQPHRGAPSGGYNKNFQQQSSPHPPAPQTQIPAGSQAQPPSSGEEAK